LIVCLASSKGERKRSKENENSKFFCSFPPPETKPFQPLTKRDLALVEMTNFFLRTSATAFKVRSLNFPDVEVSLIMKFDKLVFIKRNK